MTQARGFSLRIFLPDGEPDGLRIVEKSNWTGVGIVCPRSLFSSKRSRSEYSRTGVYLLLGPSELSDLPQAYIGEGDPVRPRLEQHSIKKDFWGTAIAFTSKDENLNKAHVKYLESRLIELALLAKRCDLDNGNTPQKPNLSEADIAEVEGFLEEMLICFSAIGIHIFDRPKSKSKPSDLLRLHYKNLEATGYESAQGFVVREGSKGTLNVLSTLPPALSRLRDKLLENGLLVEADGFLQLTQDYEFSSPSYASSFLIGRNSNGRTSWRNAEGVTLKELQEAAAKSV
jgi:hypothetical protein